MAQDNVAVELFVDDQKARATLDRFKAELATIEAPVVSPSVNPSKPDMQAVLAKYRAANPPNLGLLAKQGPINPLETSFARATERAKKLSPEIIASREQADKLAAAVQRIGPLFGVNQEAAQKMGSVLQANSVTTARWIGALGSVGPLLAIGAAAGLITYKITGDIRAEAERRLKVEELIAATANKQILALRKVKDEITASLKEEDQKRAFDRLLNNYKQFSDDALKARKATLEKLFSLTPDAENAKAYGAEISGINAILGRRPDERAQAANAAFDARWESWKKSQESEAAFARQQAEQFAESVKRGKERVEQYRKTIDDLVSGLAAQRGNTNPFVQVFTEAEEAIKRTQSATKGLSVELQAVILQQQQALNARNLFRQRLDTGLQAIDLRFDANRFRQAGSGAAAGSRLADFTNRIAQEEAGGLFRNPDYVRWQTEQLRREQERAGAGGGIQERLDRQLDFLRRAGTTAEQRAEVDRRIIALTQGVDPAELTGNQREDAAAAREREAVRLEKAERDAVSERTANQQLQSKIAADIGKLVQLAETKGVEAVIRVIDDTGGKVESRLAKRPSDKDTKAYYGLGL